VYLITGGRKDIDKATSTEETQGLLSSPLEKETGVEGSPSNQIDK